MQPRLITLRTIVAAALFGAMVTVLVSWSFALYGFSRSVLSVEGAAWPCKPPEGWPKASEFTQQYQLSWLRGALQEWESWGNHDQSSRGNYHMFVAQSGWPFLAMQSCLHRDAIGVSWYAPRDPYDNQPLYETGLTVPLHMSHAHAAGEAGWCSRRLPLRPIWLGFVINSLFAAIGYFGFAVLWRLQPQSVRKRTGNGLRRSRWTHPLTIVLLGMLLNVAVALGVWLRWQFSTTPLWLNFDQYLADEAVDQGATSLPDAMAVWPVKVPADWPDKPRWIGRLGEAFGVRGYELTSNGIPSAAIGWMHVTWGPRADDPHQQMLITQIGWPLPCLQAGELIEVAGRTPQNAEDDSQIWPTSSQIVRSPAGLGILLPNAPVPQRDRLPSPYLPLRPILLGWTVNSLVFSALLAPVLLFPGAIRTLLRRRKGRCEKCGYDLSGLPVASNCPECGHMATNGTHEQL